MAAIEIHDTLTQLEDLRISVKYIYYAGYAGRCEGGSGQQLEPSVAESISIQQVIAIRNNCRVNITPLLDTEDLTRLEEEILREYA